jgi:hypothetical protein
MKALEALADADVALLREVAATSKDAGVQKIATDLLIAAEDRGAPLGADSSGRYMRTTATGHTLHFVPSQQWKNWSIAVGALQVSAKGKAPTKVADGVEVANGVVPAFITPDGSTLVYEADRKIHVYDLNSGTRRTIGPGIAPRLLPFTQSFLFLRQTSATDSPQGTTLKYEVYRVDGTAPEKKIGDWTLNATVSGGHATPARWMRVREINGQFFLTADGNAVFALPSPFAR